MTSQKNEETKTPELPKDLGLKVGTKDEAFWTEIKNKCEADNTSIARQTVINDHILELANIKIKEEEAKH